MSRFQTVFAARERRGALRYDVRVDAVIAPGENAQNLACTIRDISQGGALLEVESGPVPEQFTLVFSRECRIVRRGKDGKKIAIEFLLPWSIDP